MAISPVHLGAAGSLSPRLTSAAAAATEQPAAPCDSTTISSAASAGAVSTASAATASTASATAASTASAPTASTASATAATSHSFGIGAALRGIGGAIAKTIGDTVAGVRLIGNGLVYKAEKALTEARERRFSPCDALPTPQIDRPFVLVPGWTTQPEAFDSLVEFLTRNGANGGTTYYVKQGQVYTMAADGQLQAVAAPPRDGRVFEMIWSDVHQSPDRNLAEMQQNLDAICGATGYDSVDAEGFSMGGLDTRLYLDKGGKQIHRFMMLGTPNRGTQFGELVLDVLDRDVKWAQKFAGVSQADRESMDWLRLEANSAKLQDLNSRAVQQRAAVPTLTVGTDVMPTPTPGWPGLGWGDGLVHGDSLSLTGGDTIILHEAMNHGRLNDDETVQHIRALFFGWGLPANAADYFPSDAEIVAKVPRPPAVAPSPPAATPSPQPATQG